MISAGSPGVVVSAIEVVDLALFRSLCQSDTALDEVVIQAAQHKRPQVLEWCYDQGWAPPPESDNDRFFLAAINGASRAVFRVLVDHGWDLNTHESETCGDTLTSSVIGDHYDFAKWLFEHVIELHRTIRSMGRVLYQQQYVGRRLRLRC